jgi:methylated-DNA-[protein]-cysteine S-methyltransferase
VVYRTFSSPFGAITLVWRENDGAVRILRIILPEEKKGRTEILAEEFPVARLPRSGAHPEVDRLAGRIVRFLRGKAVTFSLEVLDLAVCRSFQRRVLKAEFQVPRGQVITYGRLADRIGASGAARAVGNALARNPFPLVIPCHRCIREDGRLGGFRGGLEMKRALLKMEGIAFDSGGRVRRKHLWIT